MSRPAIPLPSNQPDSGVLSVLGVLQRVFLAAILVFCGLTFTGWVIVPFGRLLPPAFSMMRVNNALMALLCGGGIALLQPRRSERAVAIGRILGALVVVVACLILLKDFGIIHLPIDTLLAADPFSAVPGRVSPEAAATFLLMGMVVVTLRARKQLLSHLADAATLCICLLMLTYSALYVFGFSHLLTVSAHNPLSVQTFTTLSLLTFVVLSRRCEYGVFSILLSSGIGGKTARVGAPIAILLPIAVAFVRVTVVRLNLLMESTAIAASTSTMAIIGFCLILALSRRTNELESAIRELSLRDELTTLYNRRGFHVLAEQAIFLSRRASEPFSVLFLDVDNLKPTNDSLGHEVGSELLHEVAMLLLKTFRETDIVGRVGGDEFVVAARAGSLEIGFAAARLEEAVAEANRMQARRYELSISLGYVTSNPKLDETLDQLVERADVIMYEAKRRKKARGLPPALVTTGLVK